MVNIERFPVSPGAIRMLQTVSPVYDRAYVAKWLYEVMGREHDRVRQHVEELPYQAFPETVTWAIHWWEMTYHIPVDPSLPLETRRARLLAKRANRSPLNPAILEKIMEEYMGGDIPVQVVEHVAAYTFGFYFDLPSHQAVDIGGLHQLVRKKIPSHLDFFYSLNMQLPQCTVYCASLLSSVCSTTIMPRVLSSVSVEAGTKCALAVLMVVSTTIEPKQE